MQEAYNMFKDGGDPGKVHATSFIHLSAVIYYLNWLQFIIHVTLLCWHILFGCTSPQSQNPPPCC